MAQQPEDTAFEDLIRYIQQGRGVDFRGYKRTSLRRRVALRMERVGAESVWDYHAYLEAHPQEFVELLNTVLINVTSFFREPDAWESVKIYATDLDEAALNTARQATFLPQQVESVPPALLEKYF